MMMNKLTSRQRILLAGILGATKSEEIYEMFASVMDELSPVEEELSLLFTERYINVNIDESEILDEIIEKYKEESLWEQIQCKKKQEIHFY